MHSVKKFPQHQTMSLRGLLEADIDPSLCKLMLHEIKSPLLEHSFEIITDDSLGASAQHQEPTHSSAIHYSPKKQWMGQPMKNQLKSINSPKIDKVSITNSHYVSTPRYNNFESRKNSPNQLPQPVFFLESHQQKNSHNDGHDGTAIPDTESMVSPFQHYPATSNRPTQPDLHISLENISIGEYIGSFLTQIFEAAGTKQSESGNDYWGSRKSYSRKKIFKRGQCRVEEERIRFEDCVERLRKGEEEELANFITFLSRCLPLMSKLVPYRNHLSNNVHLLRKMFLRHQPVDYLTKETITNEGRIGNRVLGGHNQGKTSQVTEQLLALGTKQAAQNEHLPIGTSFRYSDIGRNTLRENTPSQEAQSYNLLSSEEKLEHDLLQLMQLYSQIEEHIEDYVSREKSVQELHIVYGLLYPEVLGVKAPTAAQPTGKDSPINGLQFLGKGQVLHQNSQGVQTRLLFNSASSPLLPRIRHLLHRLKIDEVFYHNNLEQLIYIWPYLMDPEYYTLNPLHFINQICRNDVIVGKEQVRDQNSAPYDEKLIQMGYAKNQ